jgi:hypothetical protein
MAIIDDIKSLLLDREQIFDFLAFEGLLGLFANSKV